MQQLSKVTLGSLNVCDIIASVQDVARYPGVLSDSQMTMINKIASDCVQDIYTASY